MNFFRLWAFLCVALMVGAALFACGSGSSSEDDDDDEGGEALGTLSGTISYEGDKTANIVVVGLIEQWPMAGPPQQFTEVEIPESGFPFEYSIEINYIGEYYLAAFMDIDEMDGVSMNAELDPMHLPTTGDTFDLIAGENHYDFTLQDPEDLDW
ncbi:MAG TPA: hypothetical protein PKW95_22195 [bacterium]|nr:hypothetical protein [bacterium]